jgi:predicted nucleic acid-binding Zn ribbon protein
MPILEYECVLCGERSTKLVRRATDPPVCCNGFMKLQVSAPARTSGNWAGTPDKKWFEEKAEKTEKAP